MRTEYEINDLAIVTTYSGYQYIGVYTYATGIDYFWRPLIKDDPKANNQLADPDVAAQYIGKLSS